MDINTIDMRLDAKRGLAIATMLILALSILTVIAIPPATAAAGTITVSNNKFSGASVLMITVSDPDLTGDTAPMPSVTIGAQTIRMFQAVGGYWVGFIAETTVYTGAEAYPATPPPLTGNLANDVDSTSAAVTDKPAAGGDFVIHTDPGAAGFPYDYDNTLALAAGDKKTIKYFDASESKTLSIDVTYDTTTGSISLDRSAYPINALVHVTVTDPDLNLDPTTAETTVGILDTWSSNDGTQAAPAIAGTTMDESDASTGVFTADIDLTGMAEVVGDTLTVRYTTDDKKAAALIKAYDATLTLDKSEYRLSDEATVTLTDPDLNIDSDAVDDRVAGVDAVVTVTSDKPTGVIGAHDVTMEETGDSTSIFTGTFTFVYDNADGVDDSVDADSPTIETAAKAKITVTYTDPNTAAVNRAEAVFRTSTGTLALDKGTYGPNAKATVTVTDMDLNLDAATPDRVDSADLDVTSGDPIVNVVSVTAAGGPLGITIIETGDNTGIFEGKFTFGAADFGGAAIPEPTISVDTAGDKVTVTYYDQANADGVRKVLTKDANFRSTTGSINIVKSTIVPDSIVVVQLTDPDLNTDVNLAEDALAVLAGIAAPATLPVTAVWPDDALRFYSLPSWPDADQSGDGTTDEHSMINDEVGVVVGATIDETGDNTGIFEASLDLRLITAAGITGPRAGDTFYVKYIDPANNAGGISTLQDTAAVRTNTGTLTIDKAAYGVNDDVTITLTDPDLNIDPAAADVTADDTVSVNPGVLEAGEVFIKSSTGDTVGFGVILEETGDDTSTFEGTVTLILAASAAPTDLQVARGDTVTVTYWDAITAGGGASQKIVKTAKVTATSGTVALDKTEYAPDGLVTVTVTDPDLNTDPLVTNEITAGVVGGENNDRIRASTTSAPAGITVAATETDVDTGVFTGSFRLGAGNDIAAADDDGLRVVYTDEANAAGQTDVEVRATAFITWHTGTISFDKTNYLLTESPTVTLTDIDLNTDPDVREAQTIAVTSTSDPAGISLTLEETGLNTGIFTGQFTFGSAASTGTILQASQGNTITAIYDDLLDVDGDPLRIKATATIGVVAEIPAETTDTTTKDSTGAVKTSFTQGETVLPTATVVNNAAASQAYLVALQMIAPDGTVYPTLYIQTTLTAGQEFTFSPSFVLPSDAQTGSWSFEVSVFDNFPAQGGAVKADPATQTFTVT